MVSYIRYIPRGYIDSEAALLRIAKTRHPDRWRPELLHEKEAEIYQLLGKSELRKSYNAAALEGLLREQIPQADLRANGDIAERLYDFNYAVRDLRIALHAGDLIAEFCDERGEFDWIKPAGWGGDEALWALFTGYVTLEDGWVRLILFKIDSIDKFAGQPTTEPKAANRPGRRAGQGSLAAIDAPLLVEMKRLIENLEAASPEEAARMVANSAHGSGTIDSKAERLARRFRESEK
jgi:hypothetical protein